MEIPIIPLGGRMKNDDKKRRRAHIGFCRIEPIHTRKLPRYSHHPCDLSMVFPIIEVSFVEIWTHISNNTS